MAPRKAKAKLVKVEGPDRLSDLPVEILHKILSCAGVRASEVVRTCVLSRRWRCVWASAPCADLRVFCNRRLPNNMSEFADCFFRERDESAPLDTLRLLHVATECPNELEEDHEEPTYDSLDIEKWIGAAIQHGARVIDLTRHPEHPCSFEMDYVSVASARLKQLKLGYAVLGGRTLADLNSGCPSLEVLELEECILEGNTNNISSASLKTLSMDKCRVMVDLTVTAPNLVLLRCAKPYNRAPSFSAMGSLAACTIILVDSFLTIDSYYDLGEEHHDYALH